MAFSDLKDPVGGGSSATDDPKSSRKRLEELSKRQSEEEWARESDVKVVVVGDSAVGKSKLMERFLCDAYEPRQLSTFALTVYRHRHKLEDGSTVVVDFWDTAGQERFESAHSSFFHRAHGALLVFDATRKDTYTHLAGWYRQLVHCRGRIPCVVVANKVDMDMSATRRRFQFAEKRQLPLQFTSAADGTNVVRVFEEIVEKAIEFKRNPKDNFNEEVLQLVEELDKLTAGKEQ